MRDPEQNGIQTIRIRNFKVFREQAKFNIRGRHMLVYGANGSGKSSLYWALYTLLQAVTKSPGETDKYFLYGGDESLLNINEIAGAPSYIFASAKVNGVLHRAFLKPTGLTVDNNNPGTWLTELDRAAEFISHRQLIGFYNFANSEEIDLINAFEDGFYPFLMGENHFKTTTLRDALASIENTLLRISTRATKQKRTIETTSLRNFNEEYGNLVTFAQKNVNRFLKKNFKSKGLRVSLRPQGAYQIVKQDRKWIVIRPMIKLTVGMLREDGIFQEVDRPQSFLNEALLTRIGVAIRFTLLSRRPQSLPLKLMFMDDLLISMDMDNKTELMAAIEKRYERHYQMFVFTHDRGLYNELRRKIGDDVNNWAIYEVNKGNFKNAKTELEKARAFLEDGDFDACALELRKLAEILLRQFLVGIKPDIFPAGKFKSLGFMIEEAHRLILQSSFARFEAAILSQQLSPDEILEVKADVWNEAALIRRPDLTQEQKNKIIRARTNLFAFAENVRAETGKALAMIKEVKEIKNRILNLGAHPVDELLYRREMEDAIKIFANFKEVLFAVS